MALSNREYGEWAISEGIDPYGPHEPPDPTPATAATYTDVQHLSLVLDRVPRARVATRHLPRTYASGITDPVPLALKYCPSASLPAAYLLIEIINSALTATSGLCEEIELCIDPYGGDLYGHHRYQVEQAVGAGALGLLDRLGDSLTADAGHGSGYWMYRTHFTAALIGAATQGLVPPETTRGLTGVWREASKQVARRSMIARQSAKEEAAQLNPVDPRIEEWGSPVTA